MSPRTLEDVLNAKEVKEAYTVVEQALLKGCPRCGSELCLTFNRENGLWMLFCVKSVPNDKTSPGYLPGGELPTTEGSCGWFGYGVTLLHVARMVDNS